MHRRFLPPFSFFLAVKPFLLRLNDTGLTYNIELVYVSAICIVNQSTVSSLSTIRILLNITAKLKINDFRGTSWTILDL